MRITLLAFLAVTVVLGIAPFASASDKDPGDITAVKACLANFEKHPFNAEAPKFRTMSAKVRVFGIGGSAQDEKPTTAPELVLVKPTVSVMSKSVLNLLNPQGWYCLKGQVSVLGATEIHLACTAKLASSKDGVTVMGGADEKTSNGVTVLGSSRVVRVGCPAAEAATPAVEKKADAKSPPAED